MGQSRRRCWGNRKTWSKGHIALSTLLLLWACYDFCCPFALMSKNHNNALRAIRQWSIWSSADRNVLGLLLFGVLLYCTLRQKGRHPKNSWHIIAVSLNSMEKVPKGPKWIFLQINSFSMLWSSVHIKLRLVVKSYYDSKIYFMVTQDFQNRQLCFKIQ